jgi:hypothetical protein
VRQRVHDGIGTTGFVATVIVPRGTVASPGGDGRLPG